MRRLRRCGIAILLLAAACGDPAGGDGPDRTLSAAEAARGQMAESPASTTTAVAAPAPTTAPASASTAVRQAPTTVTTPRRAPGTTAPAAPPPPAPPPGVYPSTGGLLAAATLEPVTTTVTEGTTTVILKAVREQYLGEKVRVEVSVTSMERIAAITIDFGNGHVITSPNPQPPGIGQMTAGEYRLYTYPVAGRYRITATATVVPGSAFLMPGGRPPPAMTWIPIGPDHPVVAAADFLQRSDRSPSPAPPLPFE